MSKYILSTMSYPVNYTFYNKAGDLPVPRKRILIHGGAGMPSDTSGIGDMIRDANGKPIWTAQGFVTTVSDADFEELMGNHVFKSHLEKGLLKVINHDITGSTREIDKATQHMESDGFRQLTPSDYKGRIGGDIKVENGRN